MAETVTARATVQVTVEIDLTQGWGHDCTIAQVMKQATSEAIGMLGSRELGGLLTVGSARIIGDPKVLAVLAGRKP